MWYEGTADDAGEAHLRPGRRGPRRGAAGATARAAGPSGQGRRRRARLVQAGACRVPGPSVPHLEVPDAETRGLPLTVGRDPRMTRIGAWMRRLKLDELPQLFNVLVGDMSLVGPRPDVPRYVALYRAPERRVLELVPGMTDEGSIRYL